MAGLSFYVEASAWPLIATSLKNVSELRADASVVTCLASSLEIEELPGDLDAERLLDRHWVIYRAHDDKGRSLVERRFFDVIADRYELEVDPARNRDNVQTLLKLTSADTGDRVLDFGCGPGLSAIVARKLGVEIVGCDISPSMRRQASLHGLDAVAPDHLPNLESSFDVLIASYVLHLAIPDADFNVAVRSVKIGGLIAGNFHKGKRVTDVNSAILRHGIVTQVQSLAREHHLHGSMRVWRRIE